MSSFIPKEYEGYWYLREFDLKPVQLDDYKGEPLSIEECRRLRRHGWLFAEYRHAERCRETMMRARLEASISAKGLDSIEFSMLTP